MAFSINIVFYVFAYRALPSTNITAFDLFFHKFVCSQDLLEAVKPILDEDVQEAVDSLLMDSSAYDAKNLYNATKVRKLNSRRIEFHLYCMFLLCVDFASDRFT